MAGDETVSNKHRSKKYVDRRSTLRLAAGTVIGSTLFGASTVAASDPDPEIRFEDQESDGTSITVSYVATDVDGFVAIREQDTHDAVVRAPANRLNLNAGETVENVELIPDDGVLAEGTHELMALLQESNAGTVDRDEATIEVVDPPDTTPGFDVRLIDAEPGSGFEYPYFLYAPDHIESNPEPPILVEPNNTGTTSDDFEEHLDRARSVAEGSGKALASQINVPLLVPVFPRPNEEPRDWTHYVHALDDTTLRIDEGSLERVDRQLLNMVKHARDILVNESYPVSTEGILLNGFSASGNFVDRFTVLHPEEVISVTAGGLNGMPLLPLEEFNGQELPYHVGISDVEDITGEEVNLDALDETNQFLYMGAEDDNDTIGFGDAWTDESLEQLALDVYGEDMIDERFPTSQEAYQAAGVDAQFRIYADAGHTPQPAFDDIVEFHRRSIAGEGVSDFGETITAAPRIDVSTETASVDEAIDFDAGESTGAGDEEIITYQWNFGAGSEATGETTTHSYEEEGVFTVTLTIITDLGNEYQTTTEVEVEGSIDDESENNDTEEHDETGDTDGQDDTEETDDEIPGFGIVGTLSSVGGAAYLLKRRIEATGSERK